MNELTSIRPLARDAESHYFFRHAAMLDAAREMLTPNERARLHAICVELLEDEYPSHRRDEVALELYRHAREAHFEGLEPEEISDRRSSYLHLALEHAERHSLWKVALELSEDTLADSLSPSDRARRLIRKCGYALRAGRSDSAIEAASQVASLADTDQQHSLLAEAACAQAEALLALSKHDEVHEVLNRATVHARESGDHALLARAHSLRGQVQFQTGNPDAALQSYESAARHYRNAGDLTGVAKVTGDRANIFQRIGDFTAAEESLHDVTDLADVLDDELLRATTLLNLSGVMLHKRDIEAGTKMAVRAEEGFRAIGEFRGLARAIANQSIFLSLRGLAKAAAGRLEDSNRIARELGESRQIASNLHQLGIIHLGSEEFEASLAAFEHCENLAASLGLTPLQASAIRHCGSVLWCMMDVRGARRRFEQAAEMQRATGQLAELSLTLVQIATLAMIDGEVYAAQPLADEALDILTSLGDTYSPVYWRVLVMLIRCEHARGDMKQARFIADEARELAEKLGEQISGVQALRESLEYVDSLYGDDPIAPVDEGVEPKLIAPK